MCCLIRAVLHPVLSAASDPGLELYKINFNLQSKIIFKRISYAYSSALDNSDPSVFFLFRLFLMAYWFKCGSVSYFVLIRIQWSFQIWPTIGT